MTPEQRRARGVKARELLASETFKGVADAVSTELRDKVFRTGAGEVEKRELLHAEYRGFTALIRRLQAWADDGTMAEAEIERSSR